jgi:hypothetical protein
MLSWAACCIALLKTRLLQITQQAKTMRVSKPSQQARPLRSRTFYIRRFSLSMSICPWWFAICVTGSLLHGDLPFAHEDILCFNLWVGYSVLALRRNTRARRHWKDYWCSWAWGAPASRRVQRLHGTDPLHEQRRVRRLPRMIPREEARTGREHSHGCLFVSIDRLGCCHHLIQNTNSNMQNYKSYFNFSVIKQIITKYRTLKNNKTNHQM